MKHASFPAIAIFAVANLFVAVPRAGAVVVQYSTTGIFSVSGTNTADLIQVGNPGFVDFIQFTGVNNVTVNTGAVPVVSNMGNFFDAIINGSSGTGSGTFQLSVDQTVPGATNGSFAPALFSGTISRIGGGGPEGATGELILTFVDPSLTIDGVQYSIAGLGQGGLAADQLGLGLYNTELSANISASATPEPTYAALIAIIGLGLVSIRRWRLHKA